MTHDEAYKIAHAAGWDTGNRSMKARGLSKWDETAWNAAVATFNRLHTELTSFVAMGRGHLPRTMCYGHTIAVEAKDCPVCNP